ncbi:ABC transporter ATP-binding protein [Infirmifilum sp.]|uniref:ABC transporter ATP-binding protein n=1 Tax=Infirmifilum sp. TaxID=2856575 RepID=UPI002356E0E4
MSHATSTRDEVIESLNEVSVVFKTRRRSVEALGKTSLELRPRQIINIVGESGSGKTTLGRVVALLQKPTSGKVLYKGVDPWMEPPKRFMEIKKKIQYVYQDPYAALNPVKTVYETLASVVKMYEKGLSRNQVKERVIELLELANITPPEYFLNKYPHHLSGGMRQRLCIVRAIIPNPEVLVADEPISMVDVSMKASILNLLRSLRSQMGMNILYITHELSSVKYISDPQDKLLVMYKGHVVEEGLASEILAKPIHPYSKILLSIAPSLSRRGDDEKLRKILLLSTRSRIQGKGCVFADRCPFAIEKCFTEPPPIVQINHRRVLCHRASELVGEDVPVG